MKLKTSDFQSAFKICDAVVVSSVQDSSQYVRLRQNAKELTLSLTGALWAEAHVTGSEGTGKWTAYVDRRALKAFLSTAPASEIELYYKDKLILKAGQRLEIALHAPISGYEAWTPKNTFDLTDLQKTVLKTGTHYLPNMAGTENVDAVVFDKDYGIFVTDTLFVMGVTGVGGKTSFVLPSTVAKAFSGAGKIASDASGTGISLPEGVLYQPLSTALANYPADKCKAALFEGQKASALLTVSGKDLLEALKVTSQFLVDKIEAAIVETKGTLLTLTVDLSGSKFQKTVSFAGPGFNAPIKWPVKKLIPWLDYALGIQVGNIEISQSATALACGVNVFRFSENKRNHILLAAAL